MRITTNAILRNYNKNLSTSMKNLDNMRSRVMTGRKYMSTAEDPSSALRATSLERKYAKKILQCKSATLHWSWQNNME